MGVAALAMSRKRASQRGRLSINRTGGTVNHPPLIGFHHGGVSVPDLDSAVRWYGDVLGFRLEKEFHIPAAQARVAMIVRDGLRMELFEVAGAQPLPDDRRFPISDLRTHGNKHLAFWVKDLDEFLSYAASKHASVAMVVRESFGRACFLRDCAGNLVEFVEVHSGVALGCGP